MSNEYQIRKGPFGQEIGSYGIDNRGTIFDMDSKSLNSPNGVQQPVDSMIGNHINMQYGNNYQQHYVIPNASQQIPMQGYHDNNGLSNVANQVSVSSVTYSQNRNLPVVINNQYSSQPAMTMMPNNTGSSSIMQDQNQQNFQNPRDIKSLSIHVPNVSTHSNISNGQVPSSTSLNQSHRLPQNSNSHNKFANAPKPWHSSVDTHQRDQREAMNNSIIHLLQQKKPNANTDWQDKLPHMAKRLEENLYYSANSLEEYIDTTTLKARLQQLAVQMGGKQAQAAVNRQQSAGSGNDRDTQSGRGSNNVTPQTNFMPAPSGYISRPYESVNQQQPIMQQPHNMSVMHGQQAYGNMNNYNHSTIVLPSSVSNTVEVPNHNQSYQNMQSHNMISDHKDHLIDTAMQHHSASIPGEQQTFVNMAQINQSLVSNAPLNQHTHSQIIQQNNNHSIPRMTGAAPNTDEHRKQVLKQQQQRLLLLRHASKCSNDQDCSVTPHCQNMKLLWKHIMSCKDQECKTAHCVSSRYVLSHYSKCKDQHCPVCAPVRDAIRSSLSKNAPMQVKTDESQGYINEQPNKKIKLAPKEIPPPISIIPLNNTNQINGLPTPPVPASITPASKPLTKLDPVSCGLYCFTNEQILAHIASIHEGMRITASKVKEICMPLIDDLLKQPQASNIFGVPVDPVFLNLPDYFEIVKSPMDLGTIKKRLESLHYRDTSYFVRDVHLTFDNAMLYNPKSSDIHHMAKQMKKDFDNKFKNAMTHYQSLLDNNRLNPDACSICGEIKLSFEPPVFYCNGHCGGQRIRRNAFFYSASNNNYHWCSVCFNDLKENKPIPLGDSTITKSELAKSKKKHQEDAEESWVECDGCGRWVHQICALFNSRRNFTDSQFSCPTCLTARRKTSPEIVSALTSKTKASDLPQCNMTEFMEKRLAIRLENVYKEESEKRGIPVSEVEKCPQLVLRQVSSIDKMQPTREGLLQRYAHKSYPQEFPCRTKCLVLFQNIDGQDVILFGMYVYEYGHKCPAPNQRRVYVSYLDSVHYFRPKQFRTAVYHEILISYLEYVKLRGFHTAHIWSCPPAKGDDYILYCHPNDQKTPKTDKLQKWYADMIDAAKVRGIVEDVADLHTEYLIDPSLDATILPYFEGDYWTTEAEVIIKALNSDNKDDVGNIDDNTNDEISKKSKRKSKSTNKSASAGRPSSRIAKPVISVPGGRDPVMAKMASIIEPMKNTFFVVRLRSKEYADQCTIARQKESLNDGERDDGNDQKKLEQSLNEDGSAANKEVFSSIDNSTAVKDEIKADGTYETSSENGSLSARASRSRSKISTPSDPMGINTLSQPVFERESSVVESKDDGTTPIKFEPVNQLVKVEISSSNMDGQSEVVTVSLDKKTSSFEIENPVQISSSAESTATITKDLSSENDQLTLVIKDDTEDADDVQESEHWDTRQSFLNLCQGNHYQFDQLRRAKHSSLLVLYLMHNPDAPKFLTSCTNCHKEIVSGVRRRCDQCDVDYCDSCVNLYSASRLHPQHYLKPMPVTGSAPVQQITAQERLDRQNALRLHLQLLLHAAYCDDVSTCKAKNCSKMKDFFNHLASCSNASRGCPTCKRVKGIIAIHARQCRQENCRVPKCIEMKDEFRRSALRQQQMDDRRRAMCNEMYHNTATNSSQSAENDT